MRGEAAAEEWRYADALDGCVWEAFADYADEALNDGQDDLEDRYG